MSLEKASEDPLEALVKRYIQGETEVCQQLLNHPPYRQRIERIARHIIKDYAKDSMMSWEDAAQTAHLKVLQVANKGLFRPKKSRFHQDKVKNFYAWAAVVAQHTIVDFIRKEQRRNRRYCVKDTVLDDLPDEFDFTEALEDADLVLKIPEAIAAIDQRYPKKAYLKLFYGLVAGKSQSELATELGVSQGEISKRRKELNLHIWKELGLLSVKDIEEQLREIRQGKSKRRNRTDTEW